MLRRDLDFPWLKSKAANAAVITKFLYRKYAELDNIDSEDSLVRVTLWGFMQMYDIVKHKNRWLTTDLRSSLEAARAAALYGFNALCHLNSCAAPPRPFFNMKPKFHQIDKIMRHAVRTGLNPRNYWTMGDESWGGDVARMAAMLHPASSQKRGVQRWLIAYAHHTRYG